MKRVVRHVGHWLDARTGHREKIAHLRDERLPAGTAWWFTIGSVLLFAVIVEIVTGVILSLYYAPTPDHAWDSIRFIMDHVRGGRFVRGLHYWGATVIVSTMALHLIRVIFTGGYRKPRELNWIVGLILLQVILAFGMSGYLLPWDQRAYWATVVRINIAQLTPGLGAFVANLLRGGADLGAMTLLRWYAVHTLLLPLILVLLVVAHVAQRRRDGASGPMRARSGPGETYFPSQAARDLTVVAAVALLLGVLAWYGIPALEPQADPTSTGYMPRPEWYFAGLFQFVKMFPGKVEVVGALVIPGLAMATLMLLPWIDRGKTRAMRDRTGVLAFMTAGIVTVAAFTTFGALDVAPRTGDRWTLTEVAGASLISSDRCAKCHNAEGIAAPIQPGHISHAQDWLVAHIADPDMIAPGLREPPASNQADTKAIVAAVAKLRAGAPPPHSASDIQVAVLMNHHCVSCHKIDGAGGKDGPDLTHEGAKADAAAIARRLTEPKSLKPDAQMPAFSAKMSQADIALIAEWLARRK